MMSNITANTITAGKATNIIATKIAPNINPKVRVNKLIKKHNTLIEQKQNVFLLFDGIYELIESLYFSSMCIPIPPFICYFII
jgi:hypothetical protein